MQMPATSSGVRGTLWAILLLAVGAVLVTPSIADASHVKVGAVYTETNGPSGNQVVAFDRYPDGTIAEAQRVATGGLGAPSWYRCGFPPVFPPCAITDSQGAVSMTLAGNLLFAVNAGDNTISSFRVTAHGLKLVDRVDSGGTFPVSLDNHGNALYVLNQVSGNIAGFRFTGVGRMTPIAGSNQSLVTSGSGGLAAQVGFDPLGRTLVVTEIGTGLIDTFPVVRGVAQPAISHPSAQPGPFGFAFDRLEHLIVSDALGLTTGAASSYSLTFASGLVPIESTSTAGGAPCWVVITPDQRFAFIANLSTKTIARLRLGVDGSLTLLGTTATLNVPPGLSQDNADLALSRDGRFLYELIPSIFAGDVSRIDEYRVGTDGNLTLLDSTPESLPNGVSGLAAW